MVGSVSLRRTSAVLRAVVAIPLLVGLLSGCGNTPKNDTFDLAAAAKIEGPSARNKQILVPLPTAIKALDSEQIVVRVSSSEIQYLSKAQWSDKLPRMVQAKLVEAFENSGKLGGVGTPGQGLAIDYQIVSDIRSFEIDASGSKSAVVEMSVKVLNDRNGTIRAQNVFRSAVPARGGDNDAYVRALDQAFSDVTGQIVDWTLRAL